MEDGVKKPGGIFLKIIILQKLSAGVVELLLALKVLNYINKDMTVVAIDIAKFFNADVDNMYVKFFMQQIGGVKNSTIYGISISLFLLALLAFTEAYGLHMRRRWGEWLTIISTGFFIPLEFFEVVKKPSWTKFAILAFNCAIVYYLLKHKDYFQSKRAEKNPE